MFRAFCMFNRRHEMSLFSSQVVESAVGLQNVQRFLIANKAKALHKESAVLDIYTAQGLKATREYCR